MQNVSKQFGAKATVSLSGRFHQARVRLTVIYVCLLVAILFLSSYTIYSDFSNRLQRRFEGVQYQVHLGPAPLGENGLVQVEPRPEDVQGDLVRTLFLANGALLLIAGLASYWLAGLTLRPIQRAYDRQRQFLGDASHELRTPLTILRTDLENELENKKGSLAGREQTQSNLEEVERMSGLVADLLTLSRLDEEGARSKAVRVIALKTVVSAVIDRLAPLTVQNQVSVRMREDFPALSFVGDQELFDRALSNVLKNAIIYNKKDGEVVISAVQEHNHLAVTVADNGPGIATEDLPKIFDRFYRPENSRSRETGGSGLGLSIVQAAMERLGGSVKIQSELGKGTTVSLLCPLHHSS